MIHAADEIGVTSQLCFKMSDGLVISAVGLLEQKENNRTHMNC
jgi:hypothetical protein